ncbi:flagellar export chaperone FlgN [Enterocloster sp. OA13]|uniref:Flagellar export chaperone FlgN n=1 Tax=Enterocloster hominis (ex Hitch et al. 2024) TaxID=1917870 RepID=A0ABV1CZX8_9FIRM|nr:flagellar export chaperone FlgN [Lachnoclostridium pacaense]EEQ58973.1 hypothetical protein CBFG_02683 [Clostridiales bacterium 1_7_47FAA]MCH1952023.1 flagellar export chaperone FlgN [Enterocloster sp. OA13]
MEEIIDFLLEYTEALEAMEQKQVEKLGLLMTRELDKVEQTIMMQQAMDKKLENLEHRRQELFTAHGLDGRTLKQIADEAKDSERKELLELYRRIDGSIGNIQYYNKKAEVLAKSELERMGIDSRMVGNPTGIYGRPTVQKGSKLEKKA